MAKLIIDNLGWDVELVEELKPRLAFLIYNIDKFIGGFKNPVIVHLYLGKKNEQRAMYDEGIINLYSNTPDWRGDFLHELCHQLFPENKIKMSVKLKLKDICRELKKNNGDGRIFINKHTYKDWEEVLCTFFKWYVLGKILDPGYLEVLDNYHPVASELLEKLFADDTVIEKSKRLVFGDIKKHEQLLKSKQEKKKKLKNPDDPKFTLQGKIKFQGMDIGIENKKGTYRKGKDGDGKEWKTFMHYPYGFLYRTRGKDKDHLDCYVGPDKKSETVFIIHQNNPVTKKYDEDKVMLGFKNGAAAKKAYLKQDNRPGFFGNMTEMPVEEFKKKIFSKEFKGKMLKSFGILLKSLNEKAVIVDIDGTIFEYKKYKKNSWGKPIKDSIITLMKIKSKGYKIILHTARGEDERKSLEKYLKKENIYYDKLKMGKPIGLYYIDDRAIEFKDNWKEINDMIKSISDMDFDLLKGKSVPVGTITKKKNGTFRIKTAQDWKPYKKGTKKKAIEKNIKKSQWINNLTDIEIKDTPESHFGKDATGIVLFGNGKVYVHDGKKMKDDFGEWIYPEHDNIIDKAIKLAPETKGEYKFPIMYWWRNNKPQLFIYSKDKDELLNNEKAKNGLASLIGVHKITKDTPVINLQNDKVIAKLKDFVGDIKKSIMDKAKEKGISIADYEITDNKNLLKAKTLPIGTIRNYKGCDFIKSKTTKWKLLIGKSDETKNRKMEK